MGICSSFVDTSDAPQIDAGEVAKRLLKTLPDLCKDTNQLATDVFPSNVQNASTNGVWAVRGYGADLTKITDDVGYKELTADTRIEDMRSAAVLSAGGIDSRWRRRAYDIVWNEMRYEVNSQLGSKPYPVRSALRKASRSACDGLVDQQADLLIKKIVAKLQEGVELDEAMQPDEQ